MTARTIAVGGTVLPADPPERARSATACRRGDHHDPRPGPGRPRLPRQHPADPRGDPHVRHHRGDADLPTEPGVRLAGQRHAHGQRRRPDPAGSSERRPASRGTSDFWWVFAGVAGFSLLTKYVIRYRGSHVFNPSNFGLVVAFIVLGSTRVEPLDFWWGPVDPALLAAYAAIIGGGLLITRRLHAAGAGRELLARAGHRDRPAGGLRPLHDRELGVRAGLRVRLLADHRDLARGHDLPVLHDHGPEDRAGRAGRAGGVRDPRRDGEHAC